MVWLLADSDAVANVVWPRASSVPVPSVVVPSLKVTVPVGVPRLWSETVAVKVTDWPNTEGFVEEVNVVVVLSLLTVCVSVGEVLPLTLASPPYTAVIGWLYTEGFAEEVVVVVELALLTVIAGLVSVLELSAKSVAVTV